jgi:plasmid maintenance system antidote protein VapI
MTKNGIRPIHLSEILRKEFLEPLEISINALAINRSVTADAALRFAKYFRDSVQF